MKQIDILLKQRSLNTNGALMLSTWSHDDRTNYMYNYMKDSREIISIFIVLFSIILSYFITSTIGL